MTIRRNCGSPQPHLRPRKGRGQCTLLRRGRVRANRLPGTQALRSDARQREDGSCPNSGRLCIGACVSRDCLESSHKTHVARPMAVAQSPTGTYRTFLHKEVVR